MSHLFVIVRHGNTFAPGEPARRVGVRTDLPLVDTGRAQAEALGRAFKDQGLRFDRILCSPLRRTRETADLIRATLGAAVEAEPTVLLAEIDHGVDENRTEDEVIARIGRDALDQWDRVGIAPPGWTVDRMARIEGWRALFAQTRPGTTLLVTSNGAARFALQADSALAAQASARKSLRLRTGAFGTIRAEGDQRALVEWDRRP
ncbi:histidine phosphatase family protein [Sphingomonas sp. PAMC 26621]|uniref:histidine phosphatase family protein n=1 Tax=Sphingomonas sp. PAMC 26621 TaxID=1112213 RepID=UPI0002892D6F|nr:histidine phosphatase family protein [Sphingomonas sp. PAMC 26621]